MQIVKQEDRPYCACAYKEEEEAPHHHREERRPNHPPPPFEIFGAREKKAAAERRRPNPGAPFSRSPTVRMSACSSDSGSGASGRPVDDKNEKEEPTTSHRRCSTTTRLLYVRRYPYIALVSVLAFAVLAAAAIALYTAFARAQQDDLRDEAINVAEETGALFSRGLDAAVLPLFSLAQFATELDALADLPDRVGQAGAAGSLPFLTDDGDGSLDPRRNVTGVCDDPGLVERYSQIASAIKRNAKMDGILHNLQLAPHGVICLLEPMINTEDFDDGSFLDSSGVWGLDVLNDPVNKYIARASMKEEELGIAGPLQLKQCPECGLYFIARLPIRSESHQIEVDGQVYPRWGFATALISWDGLVEKALLQERFREYGFEFRLTRTDHTYDESTGDYDEDVVILAESEGFGTKTMEVETALQTTNNEWIITVQYDDESNKGFFITISVLVPFFIACLIYTVLLQKHIQHEMHGTAMTQEAKVDVERNMTAYFAHGKRHL